MSQVKTKVDQGSFSLRPFYTLIKDACDLPSYKTYQGSQNYISITPTTIQAVLSRRVSGPLGLTNIRELAPSAPVFHIIFDSRARDLETQALNPQIPLPTP